MLFYWGESRKNVAICRRDAVYSVDHRYHHAALHINGADVRIQQWINRSDSGRRWGTDCIFPSLGFLSQEPHLSTPSGMMLLEDRASGRGGRQMTGNVQNENDESVIDKSLEPKS